MPSSLNASYQLQPRYNVQPSFFLQRQCACGNHTLSGGECEECKKKRDQGVLQRAAVDSGFTANDTTKQAGEVPLAPDLSRIPALADMGKTRAQGIHAKLIINQPADLFEQEADQVAASVMSMSINPSLRATPPRIQRLSAQLYRQTDSAPASVDQALAKTGDPLEHGLQQEMGQRFGRDFSQVRVHTDTAAADSAQAVNALAYTVGRDIVFGIGQYAPQTSAGKKLLAHELAHVIQQQGQSDSPRIQRQVIPSELQQSLNVAKMSDTELQERYDQIQGVLKQFQVSTPETDQLEEEAGRIGVELARRKALAEGRTFTQEAVERMRKYFENNARTQADGACIVALNKGVKLLLNNPKLPTTNETIEKTMAKIAAAGNSDQAREIAFLGKSGKITKGGARPEALNESVWDTLISMIGKDVGWSVFTMSLLDGYHTVTLTVDNNDPSSPHVFWSDQWKSKGGWKEYTQTTLDNEVLQLIQGWWDKQAEGKKHYTIVRLWRLRD